MPRLGALLLLAAMGAADDPPAARDPAPGRSRIRIHVRYRGEERPPATVEVTFLDFHGVWPVPPDLRRNNVGQRINPFEPEPTVEGKDGVIDAVVPVKGTFNVMSVTADGHRHRLAGLFFDIRDGAHLDLQVDRPKPVTLVVLDAESGEPLPGARVYPETHRASRRPPFGANRFLPSPGRLGKARIAGDRGLLRVDAAPEVLKFYVIADDHAWQAIRVLPTIGGDAVVRLPPGGELRLHVERWEELEHPRLRAFCDDPPFATHVPQPAESGDLALLGVPAGKVRFEVTHMVSETLYGAGEVEILADKAAKLSILTTPHVREGEGEVVRGTLRVPAAWRWPGGEVHATLRGRDGAFSQLAFAVPAGEKAAPFETTPLPAGRYELETREFAWRTEVEIREGRPLDLVVPEPRVAKLRFVDGAAGTEVDPATAIWRVAGARYLGADARAPAYVVRTASDRIEVSAQAPGYAHLVAEADMNDAVTLRMHRSGNLRLRLKLAGRAFGGEGLLATIVREGHEDPPLFHRGRWTPYLTSEPFCQEVARFDGLEPGRWRLSLTDIAGIEPVRETVEIRSGETTEAIVDLTRAR